MQPLPNDMEVVVDRGTENFDSLYQEFLMSVKNDTNITPPELHIRARNLKFSVSVPEKEPTPQTVLGTMFSIATVCSSPPTKQVTVLNDVSCHLAPGTLTCVLGGPSSGKTTLLKALAGRLIVPKGGSLMGQVDYNGSSGKGLELSRLVGFVHQRDAHLAALTVRETLTFAHLCQSGGGTSLPGFLNVDLPPSLKSQGERIVKLRVDAVLQMTGLSHVADTVVGDDMLRGVSGGQRKRVTLAEMLCGNYKALALDEISNGLDAATIRDILRRLRQTAVDTKATVIISLLQPSSEVTAVFDDILLLGQGYCYYYGPTSGVEAYFSNLGYQCPKTQDFNDFLLEVGTPTGKSLQVESGSKHMSPKELSEYYTTSEAGKTLLSQESAGDSAPFRGLTKYSVAYINSLRYILKRDIQVMKTDPTDLARRIVQCVVMSLLAGSLFWNMSTSDVAAQSSRVASFFLHGIMILNGQLPAVSLLCARMHVLVKQRGAGFYPPAAAAQSMNVTQLPSTIIAETLIFTTVYYFMSGRTTADNLFPFFMTLVYVFLLGLLSAQVIRALASCFDSAVAGMTAAGCFIVLNVVFSGFAITRTNIPDYWIWAYYLMPMPWFVRSMALLEYTSSTYDGLLPSGIRKGDAFLDMFDFQKDKAWIWYGLVVLAVWQLGTFAVHVALLSLRVPGEVHTRPRERSAAPASTTSERKCYPVTLAFRGVHYYVPDPTDKSQELHLLNQVSGFFLPGTMTALMGASGAGKTTLLDVLADRKTTGRVLAEVTLNGHPLEKDVFSRLIGYVEQTDIHNPQATVQEAFLFAAELRNPEAHVQSMPAFVEDALATLELTAQAHLLVGWTSVEQRKRVTMGVELAADPSILFLDEPTTGLDSYGANLVCQVMANICSSGKTLVCTIHQPSSSIFMSFHSMLLLKTGGEVVFFGPLGADACNVIGYLEGQPGTAPFRAGQNPANWMLDVLNDATDKGADLAGAYTASALAAENTASLDAYMQPAADATKLAPRPPSLTFARMLGLCAKRSIISYWRNPAYNLSRLAFSLLSGILFGSLWANKGEKPENQSDIASVMGGVFVSLMFPGIVSFILVIPVQEAERAVYYREKAVKTYNALAYFVATGVSELPFLVAGAVLFSCTFYPLFAGNELTFEKLLSYMACFFFLSAGCTFWGQCAVVWLPSSYIAIGIGTAWFAIFALFSGFLQPEPEMPEGWKFLHYFNIIRWPIEGCVTSHYRGSDAIVTFPGSDCPPEGCRVNVVDLMKQRYDFSYDNYSLDLLVGFAFCVFFRLLAFYGMAKVSYLVR